MREHVVVGAGLVGSVVARELALRGGRVIVIERRDHIAGNLYDYVDEHGIRVHRYGPHIFHTDDERVARYAASMARMAPFELTCGAVVDGVCVPTAFDFESVDAFFPTESGDIKATLLREFAGKPSATILELLENPDALVRKYAEYLYEGDFKPYAAKQWGVDPGELDKSIFSRVPVLLSYGSRYFEDKYQWMPEGGYTDMVGAILDHPGIEVELGADALPLLDVDGGEVLFDGAGVSGHVVYTGPIDELFGCRFGQLPYRSLEFDVRHEDVESFQEMPVVAYPQAEGYTRITEYNKLPQQPGRGSTYAVEYPAPYRAGGGAEPYYPVLTEESRRLYARYRGLAEAVGGLVCCGRLADFKYYDMDDAIGRALDVSARLRG